jgi:hypothetical protein
MESAETEKFLLIKIDKIKRIGYYNKFGFE